MITTNYNELIPNGLLFSIKEIDEMNLIKSDMLKKIIYNREIEVVKIGKKNFISKIALVAYLEANTVPIESKKR
ncbi:DNA-binding protein [Aliarcobacter butzleri]|jgi:hypothetical protein|uniref:DNA-binding protein n=1 Tax=Aliarcobacter butzleri TaxID=28197 RepID=UPI00263D85C8|nr:DNA-binding protein [Aliarcobacter butzleri]MDN5100365.1 DNA-binding protein [Aliarcobacter butzleri]